MPGPTDAQRASAAGLAIDPNTGRQGKRSSLDTLNQLAALVDRQQGPPQPANLPGQNAPDYTPGSQQDSAPPKAAAGPSQAPASQDLAGGQPPSISAIHDVDPQGLQDAATALAPDASADPRKSVFNRGMPAGNGQVGQTYPATE